jgi:hypothetical protein
VETVCLFQRTVDRREFGIDFGFYSRDSDENAERYAGSNQAVFNGRRSSFVSKEPSDGPYQPSVCMKHFLPRHDRRER